MALMGIRPKTSAITTVILTWLVWIGPARAQVRPPTDVRDLVVFVAKEKPDLYRLVGRQPVPYGAAKFYNPKAIVADGTLSFYANGVDPVLEDQLILTG
jgi:hypothetical protein